MTPAVQRHVPHVEGASVELDGVVYVPAFGHSVRQPGRRFRVATRVRDQHGLHQGWAPSREVCRTEHSGNWARYGGNGRILITGPLMVWVERPGSGELEKPSSSGHL